MPGYLTRRVDNGLTIMVERVEPDARTLCIALNNSQEHSGLRDDVHRHVGAITIGQAKPARGVRYGVAHHPAVVRIREIYSEPRNVRYDVVLDRGIVSFGPNAILGRGDRVVGDYMRSAQRRLIQIDAVIPAVGDGVPIDDVSFSIEKYYP